MRLFSHLPFSEGNMPFVILTADKRDPPQLGTYSSRTVDKLIRRDPRWRRFGDETRIVTCRDMLANLQQEQLFQFCRRAIEPAHKMIRAISDSPMIGPSSSTVTASEGVASPAIGATQPYHPPMTGMAAPPIQDEFIQQHAASPSTPYSQHPSALLAPATLPHSALPANDYGTSGYAATYADPGVNSKKGGFFPPQEKREWQTFPFGAYFPSIYLLSLR